jgi:hypothetical protein
VTGVGGVIISPEGTTKSSHAWGFGISSNNSAKSHTLLQGSMIANNSDIRKFIVVGYSNDVIIEMVKSYTLDDYFLASSITWARQEAK